MIEPGEMRYRAVFLRHDGTRDKFGGKSPTGWVEIGSARCARRDGLTVETLQARGVDATATSELRIRWGMLRRLGITTACRVRLSGVEWAILSIENLGQANSVAVLAIASVGGES